MSKWWFPHPHLLLVSPQIKATDNGRPQKSSTARLHIEWIRRPPPAPLPLLFDEQFYNFTVMENDKVAEIVGVVSIQQSSSPLWFDITGKSCCRGGVSMQSGCGCGAALCMVCLSWAQVLWPHCMVCSAPPILVTMVTVVVAVRCVCPLRGTEADGG